MRKLCKTVKTALGLTDFIANESIALNLSTMTAIVSAIWFLAAEILYTIFIVFDVLGNGASPH